MREEKYIVKVESKLKSTVCCKLEARDWRLALAKVPRRKAPGRTSPEVPVWLLPMSLANC